MKWSQLKKEVRQNPEFIKVHKTESLRFEIARQVILFRLKKKMTQAQLAEKIGTKQPSIARIENGACLPSLRTLQKIARALNLEIVSPKFKPKTQSSLFVSKIWKHPSKYFVKKDVSIHSMYY